MIEWLNLVCKQIQVRKSGNAGAQEGAAEPSRDSDFTYTILSKMKKSLFVKTGC